MRNTQTGDSERNNQALTEAISIVTELFETFDVNEGDEVAKQILRQWDHDHKLQSRPLKANAAAAFLIATQNSGVHFPPREIAQAFDSDVQTKYIERSRKEMESEFSDILNISKPAPSARDYFGRFQEKIGLSDTTIDLAEKILTTIEDEPEIQSSGRSPSGRAAGIVWLASTLQRDMGDPQKIPSAQSGLGWLPQRTVADICHTSTPTLRTAAKETIRMLLKNDVDIKDLSDGDDLPEQLSRMYTSVSSEQ